MNCPKCNYPTAPNQKFCENCGAVLGQAQIDVERTMAADFDEVPEVPQQPEQQASWSNPAPQEAEPYVQPVQPAPQAAQQPVQPAPQVTEQPVQPAPQADDNVWPEGGSVVSAWQTPVKDFSQMYENYNKPSQFSNGQNNSYGYAVPGGQNNGYGYAIPGGTVPGGTVKTVNKKKIAIIITSAVVAVGLIVALIIIIASCAGGSHTIKNDDGVEIASDSAIHPNDSDAEKRISAMLGRGETTINSYVKYYAKGNAAIREEKMFNTASEEEKNRRKDQTVSFVSETQAGLQMLRNQCQVDDMVCVCVLLDADNSVIYQKVIK